MSGFFNHKKRAMTCPLCHGSGTEFNIPRGITWSGRPSDRWKVSCHGCSGKGWVEVSDD